MSESRPPVDRTDLDRQRLIDARESGPLATLFTFIRLSGPGWLQSAITLGGGSLASSLFLGIVAGYMFMWVQPIAMILGIIMLSGIAYVTLSTGERPFRAINRHINPVLGWSWALAALAANMFWCLPQYALANSVLQQNLLPEYVGDLGMCSTWFATVFGENSWFTANAGKLTVSAAILVITTLITWSYDSGSWGIKVYEFTLKLMVGGIVICFFGVIYMLRDQLPWNEIAWGFVPDFSKLYEPSDRFMDLLKDSAYAETWSTQIVNQQREILISAAATAVGINMTFLFPYSLVAKRWTKEFRGLAIFDLSTGMLIPFVLATSCVVIAAADRFHTQPVPGFLGEKTEAGVPIQPDAKARDDFYRSLKPILKAKLGEEAYLELESGNARVDAMLASLPEDERVQLTDAQIQSMKVAVGEASLRTAMDGMSENDRRIATMLIKRSPLDLATALAPVTSNSEWSNYIFGLGVLGMTLSTITLLMLISGFVICEIFNLPAGGWYHRLGCMAAATGVLGPFIWGQASFYLAVYVSTFGMMLLPIAYLSFLLMMNSRTLLGENMPRGGRRLLWNVLLLTSAGVATFAAVYTIRKTEYGLHAMGALIGLAVFVQIIRLFTKPAAKP